MILKCEILTFSPIVLIVPSSSKSCVTMEKVFYMHHLSRGNKKLHEYFTQQKLSSPPWSSFWCEASASRQPQHAHIDPLAPRSEWCSGCKCNFCLCRFGFSLPTRNTMFRRNTRHEQREQKNIIHVHFFQPSKTFLVFTQQNALRLVDDQRWS